MITLKNKKVIKQTISVFLAVLMFFSLSAFSIPDPSVINTEKQTIYSSDSNNNSQQNVTVSGENTDNGKLSQLTAEEAANDYLGNINASSYANTPDSVSNSYNISYTSDAEKSNITSVGSGIIKSNIQNEVSAKSTEQSVKAGTGVYVYFDNSSYGWSTVCCYIYNSDSDVYLKWPGTQMTYIGSGIWKFEVPENYTNGRILFNNNNNGSQIPAQNQPGFEIGGVSKKYSNGNWSDYTEEPTEQPTEAPTSIPTEAPTSVPTSIPTETPTQQPTSQNIYTTIYVEPRTDFTVSNIYYYGGAKGNGWPGNALQYDSERNLYYYQIENATANVGVVICNSDGSKQYPAQGADIYAAPGSTMILKADNTWKAYDPDAPFDKSTAYSNCLWIDTHPSVTDSSIALIKWYKKSSYYLYVPSGVDLTSVPVYHTYSSLYLDGTKVTSGENFNLSKSSYSISGSVSGTLKIMQSKSDSLYIKTKHDVSYINASKDNKDSGTILSVNKDGTQDQSLELAQIKGRGNSSWEASTELFGKFAYNIKLGKAVKMFGMDKSKKWCLLANNVDQAMMRNMVVYSLADEVGLDFSPQYRSIDLYDNGDYLGTYMITEKVEIGDKNLVNITSLEDANEDANPGVDIESLPAGYSNNKKYVNNMNTPDDYTGGYLLEFDLEERYQDEASWFVSNKGQQIVVKSPEFASKQEVDYISNFFNEAEDAIYSSSGYNSLGKHYSEYIDVDSFALMYLIQELTENLDACATSFYIYKDSDLAGDGKLHASPVWDYDWTLGQYYKSKQINFDKNNIASPINTNQWWARYKNIYKQGANASYTSTCTGTRNILGMLCSRDEFWNVVKLQWNNNFYEKACGLLNDNGKIYEYYDDIKDSVAMNESRWGFIANNKSYDWGTQSTGPTHADAVNYLHSWTSNRINWLASQSDLQPDTPYYVSGINSSDDEMDVKNGIYSKTYSKLNAGSYRFKIVKNGSALSTSLYDSNLSSLGEIASVVTEQNGYFNLNLSYNGDVTVSYDSIINKIYITAKTYDITYNVSFKGNNNLILPKEIVVSSKDSDEDVINIIIENAPNLNSSYYKYTWSKDGITINKNNNTVTAIPTEEVILYKTALFFDGNEIANFEKPYQAMPDGTIDSNSIVTLNKNDYEQLNAFSKVQWYTVDADGNEFVLSTNNTFSFYTVANKEIYVKGIEFIEEKTFSATIFDPIYESVFIDNNGTVTEKVTFKFPVTLTSKQDNFNNLISAGILLIECDENGAPIESTLEINEENLVAAASGTAVPGVKSYSKAEVKPNSLGEFIYKLNITNNITNRDRYFIAYGCMTITDEDGKTATYVSKNSVMASISLYKAM